MVVLKFLIYQPELMSLKFQTTTSSTTQFEWTSMQREKFELEKLTTFS